MTSRNDTSAVRRALLWGALATAAVAVACNVPDGVSTTDEAESAASLSSSTAVRQGGDPYFEFQVEKSAELLSDSPGPRYPEMLRSAGISGRVIAQFVVGTDGLVDPGTFEVIESDHAALTQAVRGTIPHFRFTPAEIGGVKVKQHVQQPFIFQIGS